MGLEARTDRVAGTAGQGWGHARIGAALIVVLEAAWLSSVRGEGLVVLAAALSSVRAGQGLVVLGGRA